MGPGATRFVGKEILGGVADVGGSGVHDRGEEEVERLMEDVFARIGGVASQKGHDHILLLRPGLVRDRVNRSSGEYGATEGRLCDGQTKGNTGGQIRHGERRQMDRRDMFGQEPEVEGRQLGEHGPGRQMPMRDRIHMLEVVRGDA